MSKWAHHVPTQWCRVPHHTSHLLNFLYLAYLVSNTASQRMTIGDYHGLHYSRVNWIVRGANKGKGQDLTSQKPLAKSHGLIETEPN